MIHRKGKLIALFLCIFFDINHQCSESVCTLNQGILVIPILKIYDIYIYIYIADVFRITSKHTEKIYSYLDRLSIVILLYKDDVIFISPFIVYVLAVYHAMVYPLACIYLWNTLEKKLHIYTYICINIYIQIYRHQSLWKLKLKRTKQTEWVERTGQLPDWHYGVDQADLTDYKRSDCFIGSDRTDRL